MGDVEIDKKIEQIEVLVKQLAEEIMSLTEVVKSSMEVQKAMVEVVRKQAEEGHIVDTTTHEEKEGELADTMEERDAEAEEPAEEPQPSVPAGEDGVKHSEEEAVAKGVETPAPDGDDARRGSLAGEDEDEFAKALKKVLRREIGIDEFMRLV